MNSKAVRVRRCSVPLCTNTSIKTPEKLFIFVPFNKTVRNKWLRHARCDLKGILPTSKLYFCEDHFDLPNDMDNYMEYHLMGSVPQIRMKPGCMPTKYQCQPDRRKRTTMNERPYFVKKQRKTLIEECLKDLEEESTKQVELEEMSCGSSDAVKPTLPVEEQNDSMDWVDLTKECPVPTLDLEVNDEKLNGSIPTQSNTHDVKMEEEDVSFYEDDTDKENTDQDNLVHAGLKCNVCQNEIIGFRYVCVECVDWDMCSECEARAEHSHHYVLRIPAPRPQAEIQKVLQCIRHELSELLDNIQYCETVKEEVLCDTVKEEVLCDTVQEQDLSDSDPLQLFTNDNQTLPYETQIQELEEIPTQHKFHKTKSKPSIHINAPSQLNHDKDKEEISYYETREILKLKVPLDVNPETLQKSLNKQLLVNLKRLSPSNICVDDILYKSADLYEDIKELT